MNLHKALLATLAIVALGVADASPVAADPRKGEILEIDCEVLGTLEVVVFGNGRSSPGLAVNSNQVGIPYALHIEGTFTPNVGEPESFVDEFSKPAPRNGRLDFCTFHQEGSDQFGSFELDGQVWISYTPTR
jgi:hypothetical protein